jgi:hypothetical protein
MPVFVAKESTLVGLGISCISSTGFGSSGDNGKGASEGTEGGTGGGMVSTGLTDFMAFI